MDTHISYEALAMVNHFEAEVSRKLKEDAILNNTKDGRYSSEKQEESELQLRPRA